MIRIDAIWLATEPMDMRTGTETVPARVVAGFGAARPHCAYFFANRRANRMKVLVHDGVGIWLAARRLNQVRFIWPGVRHGCGVELHAEQLQALVLGLPWQRIGDKADFELGVTEIGSMAHARRKFFDLHATNKSQIAEKALHYIAALYAVEREVRELEPGDRQRIRREKAAPIIDVLHAWMIAQRQPVPEGAAIAKALDYSLKRWIALTRYLDDGAVPIDNNWCENQIRPWALGRSNWLFAGSLRSGKRAAAIMSLIQSVRLNGHDPYAYLKDVLTRLPMQRASETAELLPHKWNPIEATIFQASNF